MKKLRVVNLIPTYNEKENIAALLRALAKVAKNTQLRSKYKFVTLVVDDNSPDGTGEIVRQFQKKDRSIHLLTGKKQGLGKAMIRGIIFSLDKLKADVVIPNEADFAYEVNLIPLMLKKMEEGYDVVIPSRHVAGGSTAGWTMTRKLNHFVANAFFATIVAGVSEIKDHNGACRAMRAAGVLEKINFDQFPSGFSFFNYLSFKLTQVTAKIYEFPATYHFRTRGESKVSFNRKYLGTYLSDVWEYIIVCLRIRFEKVNKQVNA